jgi:hypothetical protein
MTIEDTIGSIVVAMLVLPTIGILFALIIEVEKRKRKTKKR